MWLEKVVKEPDFTITIPMNIANPFRNLPPVTLNLLIINTLIWLACAILPSLQLSLEKYLALYYFTSPNFGAWELVSYMFLHANFTHLFFNMFALLMFGGPIERALGSQRFLLFYMTCGICAGLVQMGVFAALISHIEAIIDNIEVCSQAIALGYPTSQMSLFELFRAGGPEALELWQYVNTPMVGASGAVYGVLLAFGFLYPNVPIYLFFIPIGIKAKWIVLGYFVIELLQGISSTGVGVAHFAHIGGMIFGLILLIYWKKKGVFNNHWFF